LRFDRELRGLLEGERAKVGGEAVLLRFAAAGKERRSFRTVKDKLDRIGETDETVSTGIPADPLRGQKKGRVDGFWHSLELASDAKTNKRAWQTAIDKRDE